VGQLVNGGDVSRFSKALLVVSVMGMAALTAPPGAASPGDGRVNLSGDGSPYAPEYCHINSTDPSTREAEYEPTAAVMPGEPRVVAAVWQQDRLGNVGSLSTDGGRVWRPFVLPGVGACSGSEDYRISLDPDVSIGPDGTVYVVSLLSGRGPLLPTAVGPLSEDTLVDYNLGPATSNAVVVNTSTDLGRSWSVPARVDVAGATTRLAVPDYPRVTADPNVAGRAYVVYGATATTLDHRSLLISRTDDGGRSWSEPREVDDPGPAVGDQAFKLLVERDGSLLQVFGHFSMTALFGATPREMTLFARRSTDRGVTWSAPSPITGPVAVNAPAPVQTGDGAVHVLSLSSAGDAVLVSSSTDGGSTWTATPRVVVTAPSVGGATALGVGSELLVLFHDGRSGDHRADWWIRAARATSAGWSERHVSGPFDLSTAPTFAAFPLGDYFGLVLTTGGVGALTSETAPAAGRGATDVFFTRLGHQ
jgi:hypothetical protein